VAALITLVGIVASLIISIALTRVTYKLYTKQPILSFKEEILATKSLIIPSFLGGLLYGLIVFGGLLLLIIPGIIFSVWYAFSAMGIVLDKKPVLESLSYSKSLVMGRFWKTLLYIFVPAFCITVFQAAISGIINIPSGIASTNTVLEVITAILDGLLSLALAPLSTIPFVILYDELKKNPTTPTTPTQA
jgi:hypothetical protein